MFAHRRRKLLRRLPLLLAVMGPGIIAQCTGNDAGGIATYAQAGARYGTKLLWLLFVITFVLAVVQEMCARMGAVTQKGLGELLREEFGVSWTFFALGLMFLANATTCVAEFAGIAAAGEVIGSSKYVLVPASAFLMWSLVTHGTFRRVERMFLGMLLLYATYLVSGVLAVDASQTPDYAWRPILRSLVTPHFIWDWEFLLLAIGVVGTTITPWMQFFLQSTVVDKGIKIAHYRYEKADVFFGAFLTDLIAFFIIVATASPLIYQGDGVSEITTAKDAARALAPVAGGYAELLFAAGLYGASLLGSSVLPLATAYTFCEAFGWEMGLSRTRREAPAFYGLYTFMIVIGALVVMLPNLPLLRVMLVSQVINGMLLPVVLIFMLKLVNNRRIMGDHVNSRGYNFVAGTTVLALIGLTAALLVMSFA